MFQLYEHSALNREFLVQLWAQGGLPLPGTTSDFPSLYVGCFRDPFATYDLHLVFTCRPSAIEVARIQSSHLRAQLYFCLASRTAHHVLAVHTYHDALQGIPRNVLTCYALVWDDGWNIINANGSCTHLSFSAVHQRIECLEGATSITMYHFQAVAKTRRTRPGHVDAPPENPIASSILARTYELVQELEQGDFERARMGGRQPRDLDMRRSYSRIIDAGADPAPFSPDPFDQQARHSSQFQRGQMFPGAAGGYNMPQQRP